jgi:glyoxylase-like metal-dependent hydrolase (beta-lactamase superfamily II)
MSLLVRRPNHAPLLLVGDLTYDANLLAEGHVPGAGDKTRLRHTVAAVNELRRRFPDLVVLPAHDPGAANRLAAALTADL